MQKGKIKFYNKVRKFGFITGDDGNDYFFQATGPAYSTHLSLLTTTNVLTLLAAEHLNK